MAGLVPPRPAFCEETSQAPLKAERRQQLVRLDSAREEDASTGAITAVATLLQLLHTQDQEAVHAASNTLKQLAGFDDSRSLVAVRLQGLPTSTMLNGKDAPNWLAEGVNAFVDLILLEPESEGLSAAATRCVRSLMLWCAIGRGEPVSPRDLAIIAGDVGYCLSVESQEAAVKAILCALVLRSQVQNEASNAYYPSRGRNSSDLGSYRALMKVSKSLTWHGEPSPAGSLALWGLGLLACCEGLQEQLLLAGGAHNLVSILARPSRQMQQAAVHALASLAHRFAEPVAQVMLEQSGVGPLITAVRMMLSHLNDARETLLLLLALGLLQELMQTQSGKAIAKLVRRHRGTALLIDCTHSLVPEIQLPAQDCLALLMQLLEEQGLLLSNASEIFTTQGSLTSLQCGGPESLAAPPGALDSLLLPGPEQLAEDITLSPQLLDSENVIELFVPLPPPAQHSPLVEGLLDSPTPPGGGAALAKAVGLQLSQEMGGSARLGGRVPPEQIQTSSDVHSSEGVPNAMTEAGAAAALLLRSGGASSMLNTGGSFWRTTMAFEQDMHGSSRAQAPGTPGQTVELAAAGQDAKGKAPAVAMSTGSSTNSAAEAGPVAEALPPAEPAAQPAAAAGAAPAEQVDWHLQQDDHQQQQQQVPFPPPQKQQQGQADALQKAARQGKQPARAASPASPQQEQQQQSLRSVPPWPVPMPKVDGPGSSRATGTVPSLRTRSLSNFGGMPDAAMGRSFEASRRLAAASEMAGPLQEQEAAPPKSYGQRSATGQHMASGDDKAGPSSSHAYSAVPSAEPFEVITVTPPQGPHITRTQKLFLRHIRRNSTVSTAGSAAQTPREVSGLSEIQPVVDPSGGSFSVEVDSSTGSGVLTSSASSHRKKVNIRKGALKRLRQAGTWLDKKLAEIEHIDASKSPYSNTNVSINEFFPSDFYRR